jgi:hypothetical protein
VSKFLLNLLVEILNMLPNSKIYLNSKILAWHIVFFLLSYGISPARHTGPLLPGLPPYSPSPAGPRVAPVPHPVFTSIIGKRPRLSAPS